MQAPDPGERPPREEHAAYLYWMRSLVLVLGLLAVWFTVSFGCGILFRDALDRFTLPGTRFPLGFWFAQQGAILVFVLLIGAYVILASRIDRRLELDRAEARTSLTGESGQPGAQDDGGDR